MSARQLLIREYALGHEPSQLDEYEHLSINQRLELFQQFRVRMIGDPVRLNSDWKDFIELLKRHGVEFMIIGGGAVNAHGFVRLTEDLDFWLNREPANAERVVRAVEEFGWSDTGLTVDALMKPDRIFMIGRKPNRIDLFTTIPGVEFQAAYPRRVEGVLDGVTIPIIGVDDLLANKRASGRHRDLGDVEEFEKSEKYRR